MKMWLTPFIVLSALISVAGVTLIFAVGKYNSLVTLRHRAATIMMEIDLLLQRLGDDMERFIMIRENSDDRSSAFPEMLNQLQAARALSHRAASNAWDPEAHENILKACEVIVRSADVLKRLHKQDSEWLRMEKATERLADLRRFYEFKRQEYMGRVVSQLF
jgi:hypothetical protein